MFVVILSAALLTTPGSDTALEPWASKAQPSDVVKNHVENITSGEHKYVVVHGGTMDGRNCRSPMGCGMNREGAIEQRWQSNRAVRMENVGQTDVVYPWPSDGHSRTESPRRLSTFQSSRTALIEPAAFFIAGIKSSSRPDSADRKTSLRPCSAPFRRA